MYIEDMRDELAEYYECAGFKDIYKREIKHKTNEEIITMYKLTFGEDSIKGEKFEQYSLFERGNKMSTGNNDKAKFLEYVKLNDISFENVDISEKTKNVLHTNNKNLISDIVLVSNEEICCGCEYC